MYLKSLTLKGFKSFADKTTLLFGPDLSVVVGPNGSGKSNISDAVLWVLGTQSAKQLRGQAMEDVIFSGSNERNKVNMAEVTLTLDNSDHTLPIDYIEVAICRRMFRNGENEYLINGAPARLMDVQDILHDSGLGRDTHSIISQGKLDSVVTARPVERTELIEEAAGIAKHRRRKDRAEKKLAKMDENVKHLKTVLREVNRRVKPLEGQVDKATRAKELTARAQELDLALSVSTLHEQETKWNALKDEQLRAQAAQEVAEASVAEKKAYLDKLTAILEEKGLFTGDIEESKGRLAAQSEAMRAALRLLHEKGRTMVERLSDTRRRLSALALEKHDAKAALSELLAQKAESEGAYKAASEELQKLTEVAEEENARIQKVAESVARIEKDAQALKQEVDSAELALSKAIAAHASAEDNISLFTSRKSELEREVAHIEAELSENKTQLAKKVDAIKKEEHTLAQTEEKLEKIKARYETEMAQVDELFKTLTQLEATTKAIDQLKSEVLSEDASRPAIFKKLGAKKLLSYINAPKEHAELLDFYLAEHLNTYLVDAAKELAEKDGAKEEFSVFAKDLIRPLHHTPSVSATSLAEVVDKNMTDDGLYNLLLRAYVVETLEDALLGHAQCQEATFITKDLCMIKPNGLFVKGTKHTDAHGFVSQIAEGKKAQKELEKTKKQYAHAQEQSEKTKREIDELSAKARESETSLELLKAEQKMLNKDEARLEQTRERTQADLTRLLDQNAKAQADIDAFLKEKDEREKKRAAAEERYKQKENELTQGKKAYEALVSEGEKTKQHMGELKLTAAGLHERSLHFDTRKTEIEKQIDNMAKQDAALAQTASALEVLRRRIEPLHLTLEAFDTAQKVWIRRLNEQLVAVKNEHGSNTSSVSEAKQALQEAEAALIKAQADFQALDVQKARLEVEVQHAVERVRTVAEVPFEDAVATELLIPVEQAQEELEAARKELQEIGPINQVAQEEFEELKERQTTISEALAELKSAKRAVDSVLLSIEQKMQAAFTQTFEAVDKNFQEVFSLLFPGGKAHLVLTDEEDMQNAGLEIVAQPAGKRLPKLALMSGGEKSLTALAFLFAVYKTRTVPFYIFDEVEAALDDANLHKLLAAIQELKKTTQLIVITHQRATMEEADLLWGVSMGTDGVSKVISQRLQHTAERSE